MNAPSQYDPTEKFVSFLKEEIASNEQAARRGTIIGAILLIFVFGYLTFSYVILSQSLEPRVLPAMIDSQLNNVIPQVREKLKDKVVNSAPEVVARTGDRIISELPLVRKELETQVFAFTDDQYRQFKNDINSKFDEGLRKHKDELRTAIQTLMNDPNTSDEVARNMAEVLMTSFKASIIESTGEDHEVLMQESERALAVINARLKKIESGKNLTEEDEKMKHFIQLMWVRVQAVAQEKSN